jgi:hypothetical protein
MLAETTLKPTFAMAVERAKDWYGISERTAERGYQQLRGERVAPDEPLLRVHKQVVVDLRSPTGLRPIHHRALADPYSQEARAKARATAQREIQRKAQKAATAGTAVKTARHPSRKNIAVIDASAQAPTQRVAVKPRATKAKA